MALDCMLVEAKTTSRYSRKRKFSADISIFVILGFGNKGIIYSYDL